MHILHSTVLQLWLVPGRKRGGIQRRKVRAALKQRVSADATGVYKDICQAGMTQ